MTETGPFDEVRRARKMIWRTRWVLVGLSALLAVALIASGAVIIGGIIGVIAVVRAVMSMQWQRQGASFRQRYPHNPPPT